MSGAAPLAAEALRRLRWRARRGLLENDLLVGRFLERHGAALGAADADALSLLLDLSEAELLDLLLGRAPLAPSMDGPAIRQVLARLQSA
jgi:antitoxin CptB